jgi:hypothetical protein
VVGGSGVGVGGSGKPGRGAHKATHKPQTKLRVLASPVGKQRRQAPPRLAMVLCGPARVLLAFGLLLPPVADAQGLAFWTELVDNIARSSNLNTRPGSTIERDVQALIFFFNNTCTASQGDPNDAANPYRGAFAQVSQWRQNEGWQSIVEAHSNVQVQCRTLYMEGGEEFAAKHCFWNIGSLEQMGGANGTSLVPLIRYPDPEWTMRCGRPQKVWAVRIVPRVQNRRRRKTTTSAPTTLTMCRASTVMSP